jgi:hypothetical protein
VYENVNVTLSNLSAKTQFPAELTANLPGGGTFKLEGNIGPLNPADSTLTPLDTKVTTNDGVVSITGEATSDAEKTK